MRQSVSTFLLAALGVALLVPASAAAQTTVEQAVGAFPMREVGPAVAGGRIADIEVSSTDKSTWFVAVGSGGVWKTTNAGTTWTPVFDGQSVYSIGEIALDPSNPNNVWVGTGENVSGRHVGWGDGVYRSRNGGMTWTNVGLPHSEHIGKILVHPEDSDRILVAAEGPLWSSGGDRGVYRSDDGGDSWEAVLSIDENTGVTDMEFHPTDPSIVYAATFQRQRRTWGYMAGGEGSGIWKSTDAGETWREITTGLPSGDMGKIGIAVTPADPDRVYATIEAGQSEQGFYRSMDEGESWERRNSYISGGTGPHYYQEIEASPTEADIVIQMDVFFQITRDGGASFGNLETGRDKHSDNHALWIDPDNPRHMLGGTDAGLYETFDRGTTWRHFPNMPIAQFYKVAMSNRAPFYDLLVGAQDLGTLLAPSRTITTEGIRNDDWVFPLGADGYGVQIDPTDPDIGYMMTQQGNLVRTILSSGEVMRIQPKAAPGEPIERWNWDSPIIISPHDSDRIFFASQRLWQSNDRGNSWTAISEDLTTGTDRYELPYMGRVWELDAMHDNGAMSQYATLTSISESPVAEGRLYTGSDDGLIHATTDGGSNWTRTAPLPGVPERSFINKVVAGEHSATTVFALADAHKLGDYAPYIFRSNDGGSTWTSIRGDLPDGMLVWALQQDHVNPDLLFVAAEKGLYFTINGGTNWSPLAGTPTIAFRDVQLHRRDNDVVGATFGRGVYILDDYSPLRSMADGALDGVGGIMPVRDAWWYVQKPLNQANGRPTYGSDAYAASNPDFGAALTFFIPEVPSTSREDRRAVERDLRAAGSDAPFPGYETLRAEAGENGPQAMIRIADSTGEVIRLISVDARAGVQRVTWDLRRPAPNPINFANPTFRPPWAGDPLGPLAAPGIYSAQLMMITDAGVAELGASRSFEVRPLPDAPAGTDFRAVADFQYRATELQRRIGIASSEMGQQRERLRYMRAAVIQTPGIDPAFLNRIGEMEREFDGISLRLQGDPIRGSLNVTSAPTISARAGNAASGPSQTTQMPTATHVEDLRIATEGFAPIEREIAQLISGRMTALEQALADAGAPWTPGRRVGG